MEYLWKSYAIGLWGEPADVLRGHSIWKELLEPVYADRDQSVLQVDTAASGVQGDPVLPAGICRPEFSWRRGRAESEGVLFRSILWPVEQGRPGRHQFCASHRAAICTDGLWLQDRGGQPE